MSGLLKNVGNGMIKGSWGSRTLSATYCIYKDVDNALYDAGAFESDDGNKIEEFLKSWGSKGTYNIKVDVVESYDHSVGVDYEAEIENIDYGAVDRAREELKKLPTKNLKFKNAVLNGLNSAIERLESDESVIEDLDIDYPED